MHTWSPREETREKRTFNLLDMLDRKRKKRGKYRRRRFRSGKSHQFPEMRYIISSFVLFDGHDVPPSALTYREQFSLDLSTRKMEIDNPSRCLIFQRSVTRDSDSSLIVIDDLLNFLTHAIYARPETQVWEPSTRRNSAKY